MLFADSKVLFTFVHFFSLFFQHPLHCWIWRSILLKKKKEWRRNRHQLQNGKIQEMRVAIVFTRQRFFTSRFITSHPPFLASSRSGRELYPLKRWGRSHLSVARKESQSRVPARREPAIIMLPRTVSLPFMIIILVLIVAFLCMMGYFHLWFACHKCYRKRYQEKHPPQSHEEIQMQTLKTTTDPAIFQGQKANGKQIEYHDLSLIWRQLITSNGDICT